MSVGRGRIPVEDATALPRTFGRGRARFSAMRLEDDDETSMALLRRQLEFFARRSEEPLTPVTPSAPPVEGQFADSRSDTGASTPPRTPSVSSGSTSGIATPKRRPRCASEAASSSSSSALSTPRSNSSYNFRGNDDPNCVCYREKKQVICRMCGDAYLGRVRKKCSVHCNVRMLMDNDLCANCGIPCLFEYDQDGTYDRD